MTEVLRGAFAQMIELFRDVNAGNYLWFVYFGALIYLLIFEKEKRKSVALPSMILTALILNPLTVWAFGVFKISYVYWRAFWLIPIVIVIPCAAVCFITRWKKNAVKGIFVAALGTLVVLGGTSVYRTAGNEFVYVANPFKMRQYAVEVARALLAYDAHPRVVATAGLATHLRIYSTDISLMYGRDIAGFMGRADELSKQVSATLYEEEPDIDLIRKAMEEKEFTYLVRKRWNGGEKESFEEKGFEYLETIGNGEFTYDLYRLEGG